MTTEHEPARTEGAMNDTRRSPLAPLAPHQSCPARATATLQTTAHVAETNDVSGNEAQPKAWSKGDSAATLLTLVEAPRDRSPHATSGLGDVPT